jgi:hypothetical protein
VVPRGNLIIDDIICNDTKCIIISCDPVQILAIQICMFDRVLHYKTLRGDMFWQTLCTFCVVLHS